METSDEDFLIQAKLGIEIWEEHLKRNKKVLNDTSIKFYVFDKNSGLKEQEKDAFMKLLEDYYTSDKKQTKYLTYLDYILNKNIVKAVIKFDSQREYPMTGTISFKGYKVIMIY